MNEPASSPISLPSRVIVFDYGEVISRTPTPENRAQLLTLAGIADPDADAFWQAYWDTRAELDRGTLPIADYWHGVARATGRAFTAGQVHQLWLADFTGWLSIDPGTAQIIDDLAAGGTRLALLSNAGPDFSSFFRSGSLGDRFERVFVSGELELVKPDAAIFEHMLGELGVAAEQVVFIDNKAENVEGAAALGIIGHVFTSPGELRAFLTTLA